jgi:hypothetical protein
VVRGADFGNHWLSMNSIFFSQQETVLTNPLSISNDDRSGLEKECLTINQDWDHPRIIVGNDFFSAENSSDSNLSAFGKWIFRTKKILSDCILKTE